MSRTSWKRQGASQDEWHLSGDKGAFRQEGEPLKYIEYHLKEAMFSPLPRDRDLEPEKNSVQRETESMGKIKLPCVVTAPKFVETQKGLFPIYCFGPDLPVLRVSYSLGAVGVEYNHIAKVQNRFLPREIKFYTDGKIVMSASVEAINAISPADAALAPPADTPASDAKPVNLVGGLTQGMLLKKIIPVYPQDAKRDRIDGTVELKAIIGRDGSIHDLRVLSAPAPSLAASALWAVSHWQYKPYLLNGSPVEIETTIQVVYGRAQ